MGIIPNPFAIFQKRPEPEQPQAAQVLPIVQTTSSVPPTETAKLILQNESIEADVKKKFWYKDSVQAATSNVTGEWDLKARVEDYEIWQQIKFNNAPKYPIYLTNKMDPIKEKILAREYGLSYKEALSKGLYNEAARLVTQSSQRIETSNNFNQPSMQQPMQKKGGIVGFLGI